MSMPAARKTARSTMSATATSATPLASGSKPRSLFPSKSDADSRNSARTLHTSTQTLIRTAPISPFKFQGDTSIDDPFVLSDSDTDMETSNNHVRRVFEVDSSDDEIRMPVPVQSVKALSLPLSILDAANNHDESRSSTTLDQSYATSLNSEMQAVSDGSLSSLSSIDSDSDAAETNDGKSSAAVESIRHTPRLTRNRSIASTPLQNIEATSEASVPSSSSTPTPSRRSARIVSSGSSVQKALQRRDELDAKMLASPVRRKPESPEAPPAKKATRPTQKVGTRCESVYQAKCCCSYTRRQRRKCQYRCNLRLRLPQHDAAPGCPCPRLSMLARLFPLSRTKALRNPRRMRRHYHKSKVARRDGADAQKGSSQSQRFRRSPNHRLLCLSLLLLGRRSQPHRPSARLSQEASMRGALRPHLSSVAVADLESLKSS